MPTIFSFDFFLLEGLGAYDPKTGKYKSGPVMVMCQNTRLITTTGTLRCQKYVVPNKRLILIKLFNGRTTRKVMGGGEGEPKKLYVREKDKKRN